MKEEIEHNFYCVISNGNLYWDCVYKPARTKRSEGWLSYFFSLNTINARVVFVAQLLERRFWEVSGSILDRVTNIHCIPVNQISIELKYWKNDIWRQRSKFWKRFVSFWRGKSDKNCSEKSFWSFWEFLTDKPGSEN